MFFITLLGITAAVTGLLIEAMRIASGGGVLVIVGVIALLISTAKV